MKYPSPQEIEEMRVRGYDQSVIEEAVELSKRWLIKEKLKIQIREAFAGVTLGAGVGLYEAQGLDDYASEEKCAQYREKDEKIDWQVFSAEDLNQCYSSLSFFDAEGMRFHLPAYLIADLNDGMDSPRFFTSKRMRWSTWGRGSAFNERSPQWILLPWPSIWPSPYFSWL